MCSTCLAPNLKADHNIQVTTAVATGRLVGKPAVLRDICDAVEAESNRKLPTMIQSATQHAPILSTYRRGRFACLCSHRQRLQCNNVIFGSLVISHERVTEEHLPGCPATQILTSRDQSEKIGLTFTRLRRLLNSAIQVSFALPSGAGGWSLSPSFTYYPTVNAKTDPAFRVMSLLRRAGCLPENPMTQEWWDKTFVPSAVSVVLRLLRGNKTSARAVDAKNKSLMHHLAKCVSPKYPRAPS